MINKNEINSFNNNKSIVPQYNVTKEKYNPEEKILLTEVRENLVDIAMSSDENLQVNERKLLRYSGFPISTTFSKSNKYKIRN